MFMKWCFSLFILLCCSTTLSSKDIHVEYFVKTKGITIGKLVWNLKITENYYETTIELKEKGFLSGLYDFRGSYATFGKIKNKLLIPSQYSQSWTTKKKQRDVKIYFKDHKINELNLMPLEKEHPRISYKNLEGYNDPLTSFINILLNSSLSRTIDGRRTYLMEVKKIQNHKKIFISEYTNIWADHKKNDLEYLEVFQNKRDLLPKKIIIKFKGSIFYLINN